MLCHLDGSQTTRLVSALLPLWATCWLTACIESSAAVEISKVTYQGRPHFKIDTQTATWYYDERGGGFSRLLDKEGRDWIAFRKEPLSDFPASAASGFRGLPNCVFKGPDKGAGHPGFDQCESLRIDESSIRTRSRSGKWQWRWEFSETSARFSMERADKEYPWWFLYEGPVGGSYEPAQKVWVTDTHPVSRQTPDRSQPYFGEWQTVAMADQQGTWALVIHQHANDALADTLWYLGNTDGGRLTSPDGMIVLGFGRGPGTQPLLRGDGLQYTVGLVALEKAGQLPIQRLLASLQSNQP